jgi:excisionase family DNA binding protein
MPRRKQGNGVNYPLGLAENGGAAPMSVSEPLLTAREVSAYLNLSKITIYEWAHRGKIPAFRLGHHWRFRRSEIEAWLDRNRQSGAEESRA